MLLVVALAAALGGCGIFRSADDPDTGALAPGHIGMPHPDAEQNWVPLVPPGSPANPSWPMAPHPGTADAGQSGGLALVVREIDAVARLVDHVSRMPHDPGRYSVNFTRIQADLHAIRSGLVEAILQPHVGPREYPRLHGQYRE